METWKVIEGTRNNYMVSTEGNISKNGKVMKQTIDKNGYHLISIGFVYGRFVCKVHRLVAVSFCNTPDDYDRLQVNHIDGNKSNNCAANLEWCTPKENQEHRRHILGKNMIGEKNPMYGMSGDKAPMFKGYILKIDPITNEVVSRYAGSGFAAKDTGKKACNILRAIKVNRLYCGYFWKRE